MSSLARLFPLLPCLVSSTRLRLRNQDVEACWRLPFSLVILITASRVGSSPRVSWMLLQCALQRRRPVPIERRGGEAHKNTNNFSTNPLYNIQVGDERTDRKSVLSRSSSCSESRNVQPQSYPSRTPMTHHTGNLNHSSIIPNLSPGTEVLANQLIGTCAR